MVSPDDVLPRALGRLFSTALETARVVVVTGPRQAGKSTFVQIHPATANRPYFTLDHARTLLQVETDRSAFLRSGPTMVIDEVQRDDWLLARYQGAGRRTATDAFTVRSCSRRHANLLLMQRVGDSLAGRAIYLHLSPRARREQLGFGSTGSWTRFVETSPTDWLDLVRADPAPSERWQDAVRRGRFPAVVLHAASDEARALWFDSYVATYLERDLRDLRLVSNLRDFQALMRAAALRIGSLLNTAELARDVQNGAEHRA